MMISQEITTQRDHVNRMRAIAKRAVIDLGYIQTWIAQQKNYPVVENYCVTALDSMIDEINNRYPANPDE